jgi:hypothetical protein
MDTSDLRIELYCRVLVELVDAAGEIERREFTIVPAAQADSRSGLLDGNSPLGLALLGRFAGVTVPYRMGGLREVRILDVRSGGGPVPAEAAEKRRADVRRAEAQSEITDQMIFAGASGSKWGDYEVNMDKLFEESEPDQDAGQEPKKAGPA